MHLKDELRFKSLLRKTPVDVDHSNFDNIRSSALYGHVQRHALAERAYIEIGAFKLRQISAAREQRIDISVRLGLFHDALHIIAHAVVFVKIGIHVRLRFAGIYSDVLCQRKRRYSVYYPEVYRLCPAAQSGRHLVQRNSEHP